MNWSNCDSSVAAIWSKFPANTLMVLVTLAMPRSPARRMDKQSVKTVGGNGVRESTILMAHNSAAAAVENWDGLERAGTKASVTFNACTFSGNTAYWVSARKARVAAPCPPRAAPRPLRRCRVPVQPPAVRRRVRYVCLRARLEVAAGGALPPPRGSAAALLRGD